MACVRKYRSRWVVDYREPSGRRRIETCETKSAAQGRLAELLTTLRNKTFDPTRARTLIRDYAPRWLEMRRHELKPSTLRSYEQALRLHVLPVLGDLRIGDVSRDAVRIFVAGLFEKRRRNGGRAVRKQDGVVASEPGVPGMTRNLSRGSVRIAFATLRAMLQDAVDSGIIPTNHAARAAKQLGPSQAERRERVEFFSREELALFLRTASTLLDPTWFPFFFALARTGLRLGEALGLKVGDLDFVGSFITVRRTYTHGKVGTPKNGKTRRVDLSTQLAEVLRDRVRRVEARALATGAAADLVADLWLFTNADGGPLDESRARKQMRRVCRKAGLRDLRVHGLRHTFASLLIQQGEPLAYVRDQLGHYSIQLTVDTYGHLVPGANRAAVDRLDDPELDLDGNKWKQAQGNVHTNQIGEEKTEENSGALTGPPRDRTEDPLIKRWSVRLTPSAMEYDRAAKFGPRPPPARTEYY
jgi:integrase